MVLRMGLLVLPIWCLVIWDWLSVLMRPLEVIFVLVLVMLWIMVVVMLTLLFLVGLCVIPFLMALLPVTACPMVAWPLRHPVIWMRWEEGSAANGVDGGDFPQCDGPTAILNAAAPYMDPLLSLFRSPYQRVAQPHWYDATLFCIYSAATVLSILVCVTVPLLVYFLLCNPFFLKYLTPPLI